MIGACVAELYPTARKFLRTCLPRLARAGQVDANHGGMATGGQNAAWNDLT